MTHDPSSTPATADAPQLVYRLCSEQAWRDAVIAGVFSGTELDQRDGFIHLSGADQVADTADAHFKDVRPLMLLTIDTHRVDGEVRWEKSRDGALFPHLYGTFRVEAVLAAQRLAEDRFGVLMVPLLMTAPGDLGP